jgi:hypothetical protein
MEDSVRRKSLFLNFDFSDVYFKCVQNQKEKWFKVALKRAKCCYAVAEVQLARIFLSNVHQVMKGRACRESNRVSTTLDGHTVTA